jgi:UDP-N-acetylglucosamine acyltransferase
MSHHIHATAIIEDGAVIGEDCEIGPYVVIQKGAVLGSANKLGPHVLITGATRMGHRNSIKHAASIGGGPQDIHFTRDDTLLYLGDDNHIGEHCTLHRGSSSGKTTIGNHNYLMGNIHVGHDCTLGNNIIMANDAKLGGWVTVFDKAIISAGAGVHQFTRIGDMVMVGGLIRVTQDLLPYTTAARNEGLNGLNLVGLKRSGCANESINLLKQAYTRFCRQREKQQVFRQWLGKQTDDPYLRRWLDFMSTTDKRGYARHPTAKYQSDL